MFRYPSMRNLLASLILFAGLIGCCQDEAPKPNSGLPAVVHAVVPFEAQYQSGSAFTLTVRPTSSMSGEPLWSLLIEMRFQGKLFVDHMGFSQKTMALRYKNSPYFAFAPEFLYVWVSPSSVDALRQPIGGGEPVRTLEQVDSDLFEESQIGLLMATLNLEEGQVFEVPVMAAFASSKSLKEGSVICQIKGSESLVIGETKYACTVVDCFSPTIGKETYFVARQAPYLIKKVNRRGTTQLLAVRRL